MPEYRTTYYPNWPAPTNPIVSMNFETERKAQEHLYEQANLYHPGKWKPDHHLGRVSHINSNPGDYVLGLVEDVVSREETLVKKIASSRSYIQRSQERIEEATAEIVQLENELAQLQIEKRAVSEE